MTDPAIVWHIGADDPNPLAFNSALLIDGADIPPFVIGVSDPARDWPQVQPGPLNEATGFRDVSVSVQFEIDDPGDECFELVLDLIQETGPCPELDIRVNGVLGSVLLESKRVDRTKIYGLSPITAHVLRSIALPPGSIVAGTNIITISTTSWERPTEEELVEQLLPIGVWFGSAVAWRGLSLRRSNRPAVPVVRVCPLPLFVEKNGDLCELVDVIVTVVTAVSDASVELSVGSHSVSSGRRRSPGVFGDLVFRLEVEDLSETVEATVAAVADGWTGTHDFVFRPARKWELQLIPHTHIDLGYSDYPGKTIEVNSRNIERALDILDTVPDFRLSVDGTYILDDFVATRSADAVDALTEAMAGGSIHVNPNYFNMLTGVSGLEDLYRSYYRSAEFARQHGLQVGPANITDVPSYTSSLPSILASAGVADFMGIINHYHGGNDDSDVMHMLSPLRWRGPDGAEVLAAFSDCYTQLRYLAADPPTIVGMASAFTRYVNRYDRDDYLPQTLPIMGTHADNEDLGSSYADLVERWNSRYAYPKLRFSTVADYFDSIRHLYDDLPVVSGDGGSYWEDGAGTQGLIWTRTRAVQRLLPAAEGLAALVAEQSPRVRPNIRAFDEAWHNILIGDEHTWGSGFSVSQPDSDTSVLQLEWKLHHLQRSFILTNDEVMRGLSQLAELIGHKGSSLVVYNPSSRRRTVAFEIELPDDVHLVDSAGHPVTLEPQTEARDRLRRVRFQLIGMEPFGYELLTIHKNVKDAARPNWLPQDVSGAIESAPAWQIADGPVETSRYTLTIDADTGRLRSLRHRATQRELIDPSSVFGLADIVHVSGDPTIDRTLVTSLNDRNPYYPVPKLNVERASTRVHGVRRENGCVVVRLVGESPTLSELAIEIRLFENTDRVEITVDLEKIDERDKEAIYVAFPFLVDEPVVRYDRHLSWVDPVKDALPGAGSEWFALQNGASVGADRSVLWASPDAPLFTSSDIFRGHWPSTFTATNGHLFSYILNNYWHTNTPAGQSGKARFRFAFWPSGKWDEAAASARVRDFREPGLVNEIVIQDFTQRRQAVLPKKGSLLTVELDDGVDVTAFAGRAAPGVLLRIASLSEKGGHAAVEHPRGQAGRAWLCTAVEDRLMELPVDAHGRVSIDVSGYEVKTLLLGS
ncbi:hypothetical protein [Diaminobutyricibacter sp. McL0608]|uniref:glycoside hydrolase family 38 N-terminal domain-containing protein n=1 Tax=Leifsonia sp. McL0608 TaxID=3143537 RepID=UPI0031F32439